MASYKEIFGDEAIKLSELIEACEEYDKELESGKEDGPKKEEFLKIFSKMRVIPYLTIQDKTVSLTYVMANCESSSKINIVETEVKLHIAKIIFGLLRYVVNLENDLDFSVFSPAVVDLLFKFNIIDSVLQHCGADYARFEKMVDEAINFSNLMKLADIATLFVPERIDEFVKEVRSLKEDLTPERIKDLKSIATLGSPEWAALKQTVADEVLGKIMDSDFEKLKTESKEENENK